MDEHIQSRGHLIWLICIIAPIVTAIFVGLRAYARIFITKKLAASDWVCFITLTWIIAFSVTLAQATYSGMGRHKKDLNEKLAEGMDFWILVSSVFYVLSLGGYKVALLLLYLQIFGVSRRFRYICYGVMAYTIGYLFCNLIVQVAGCTPIEKFWKEKTPGHCTKTVAQDIAFGVGHMTSDFLIAMLPLPMVWRLQLRNMKERVGLLLVLGTGVIAWIVAVVRFTYATIDLTSSDRTWIAGATFFLSVLEVNTGLICGCTPALKPLFMQVKDASYGWSRKMSSSYAPRKRSLSYFSRKRSEGPSSDQSKDHSKGFTELKEISGASSSSAPNSRRPTFGENSQIAYQSPNYDPNANYAHTNAGPVARPPIAHNPGSDTWDDYSMTFDDKSTATHPPASSQRAAAVPPLQHMSSDELFKGTGVAPLSGFPPRDAENNGLGPRASPSAAKHPPKTTKPTQQRGPVAPKMAPPIAPAPAPAQAKTQPQAQAQQSDPMSATDFFRGPDAPQPPRDDKATAEQQAQHHLNRAQILLNQQNRPPSGTRVPTLSSPESQPRYPARPGTGARVESEETFGGSALLPVHEGRGRDGSDLV